MENHNQNNEKYIKAIKKVEDLKGFYGHLTSFILVNILLLIINLQTTPNHIWFFWATFGWGIGVVLHGVYVFDLFPFFGKKWEEEQIKKIMNANK